MPIETLEAVFEHGGFRILTPRHLTLREGQRVRIIIEPEESPESLLELATSVYIGMSPQDITEVEQIALHREDIFGRRV